MYVFDMFYCTTCMNKDDDDDDDEALRLLVSKIDLFLCKCPPFCTMASKMADTMA